MPKKMRAILIGKCDWEVIEREAPTLISVIKETEDYEEGYTLARDILPEVIFVSTQPDAEEALNLAQRIVQSLKTSVIIASNKKDPDLILRAMRIGVKEFLVFPTKEGEIFNVLKKIEAQIGRKKAHGKFIAVFSGKGGTGTTTLAINLADHIRRYTDALVAIIDLNLPMGDVDLFLDLQSCYTIVDLLNNLKRLDKTLLLSSLTHHKSGLYVLADPENLVECERITGTGVTQVLTILKEYMDYIVADLNHNFDEVTLAALDIADTILLITQQSVPIIRNTQRCLDLFKKLGYSQEKVKLVINRYLEDKKMPIKEIEDILGHPISFKVVNDYYHVIDAINEGVLLSQSTSRSKVNADIAKLAQAIIEVPKKHREINKRHKRPLLKNLFRFFYRRKGDEVKPDTGYIEEIKEFEI